MTDDPNATRISGGFDEEPGMDMDPGEEPKSNRNLIIAIVAAVVVCCCCSTAAGFYYAFSSGAFNF